MSFVILIINPLLGLLFSIRSFSKRIFTSKWVVISITGVVFFFLGYSVILTNMNADLEQYFSWLPNYGGISYSVLFNTALIEKNVFVVQQFMLSFFGKLQNDNLFSGFIVSLFYSSYMYINATFISKNDITGVSPLKSSMAINFGLTIISFGWVLTSVRNPMANALIAIAVFRDLYLHKKDLITITFYFMGLSMHVAVLPIIVCRMLVGIVFSKSFIWKTFNIGTTMLLVFISIKSNIVSEFNNKIDTYGLGSTGGGFSQYAHSSIYYRINSLFFLWLMILSIALLIILKKNNTFFDNDFRIFLISVSILAIISYFAPTPLIDRYGMFVEIFLPLLLMSIDYNKISKNKKMLFYSILSITGIFGFFWQMAYLSYQIDIWNFMYKIIVGWFSLL